MDNENKNPGFEGEFAEESIAEETTTEVESNEVGSNEVEPDKKPYVFEDDNLGADTRRHVPIEKIILDENDSRVRDMVGLEESIHLTGLKNPVRVQEGSYKLISGRRRLEVCRRLGHPSVLAEVVRCSDDEAELQLIDDNLWHLPLTVLEQGEFLLRREALLDKLGKKTPSHRPKKGAKLAGLTTTKEEGRPLNLGERTTQERKSIAKNLTSESKDLVRKTPIANNGQALKRLSALEGEEQTKVLDAYLAKVEQLELVKPGSSDKQAAGLINMTLNQFNRDNRNDVIVRKQPLALEDLAGRYPVVYADPPWRYTKNGDPTGNSPETHYETMTIEEICALPVSKLAQDDAVLFMWTTKAHLLESIAVVMPAWGFTYKSFLVWEKDRPGQGCYSRDNAELLLVGTRGNLPHPIPKALSNTVVKASRTRHAKKPDEFYELLNHYYPRFMKVELFCRESYPGYASWGNEIITVDEDTFGEDSIKMMQHVDVSMTLQGDSNEFARRFELAAA